MVKIVEITWWDAACEHENLSLEGAGEINPMKRKSVGYLIKKNKDKIVISFGSVEDKEHKVTVFQDTLVVPRGDVQDIKELSQ